MSEGSTSSGALSERFVHRTDRGQLRMWLAAPTVIVVEYEGYSDESFVDFIESSSRDVFERPSRPFQIFVDTEGQTGHASGFRARMLKWSRRLASRTDTSCYLVRSRWVAMGIAILKASVGLPGANTEITMSREVFRSRLDTAVRQSLRPA
jgi:hypothetical protein